MVNTLRMCKAISPEQWLPQTAKVGEVSLHYIVGNIEYGASTVAPKFNKQRHQKFNNNSYNEDDVYQYYKNSKTIDLVT